jgi:hypothetical protein
LENNFGRDAGDVWKLPIDVCAVPMTLVSLTGFALIFFLAKRRFSGLMAAPVARYSVTRPM